MRWVGQVAHPVVRKLWEGTTCKALRQVRG